MTSRQGQADKRISGGRLPSSVTPGGLLYAGSPEGAGILAAQRGGAPFAVTTQVRTVWR
jgi:hypothetical protein